MRAYVDYLTSRAQNHIVSFGLGDWYDYGVSVQVSRVTHRFRWLLRHTITSIFATWNRQHVWWQQARRKLLCCPQSRGESCIQRYILSPPKQLNMAQAVSAAMHCRSSSVWWKMDTPQVLQNLVKDIKLTAIASQRAMWATVTCSRHWRATRLNESDVHHA